MALQVRDVHKVLQAVSDDELPFERQAEADGMLQFLKLRIDARSGGTLFVAGRPGTGKCFQIQIRDSLNCRILDLPDSLINADRR
jgi:hypothetical protein